MPEPKVYDPRSVLKLFVETARERFWGSITFSFQNGTMVMIRKESTQKVKVDFSDVDSEAILP
jgi:hypothetical protein